MRTQVQCNKMLTPMLVIQILYYFFVFMLVSCIWKWISVAYTIYTG